MMPHTTPSNYQQAQNRVQGIMTRRVVLNDEVFPHWIENSNSPCACANAVPTPVVRLPPSGSLNAAPALLFKC